MSDGLQHGDRVLDLRAVARSGGMFAGLIATPVAAGLSNWWWGWCVFAAVAAAVVGFVLADNVGRLVFLAPPDRTVVARVGPASLGIALWASVVGGLPVIVTCAVFAFAVTGGVPAMVTILVGVGVSVGAGCLAALV